MSVMSLTARTSTHDREQRHRHHRLLGRVVRPLPAPSSRPSRPRPKSTPNVAFMSCNTESSPRWRRCFRSDRSPPWSCSATASRSSGSPHAPAAALDELLQKVRELDMDAVRAKVAPRKRSPPAPDGLPARPPACAVRAIPLASATTDQATGLPKRGRRRRRCEVTTGAGRHRQPADQPARGAAPSRARLPAQGIAIFDSRGRSCERRKLHRALPPGQRVGGPASQASASAATNRCWWPCRPRGSGWRPGSAC